MLAAGAAVVAVLLRASTAHASLPPASLPLFNITASSLYDAGREQGRLAASRIRGWLRSEEMVGVVAFARGPGRAAFERLVRDNSAWYPQYVPEVRGIAAGAGIGLDEAWVLNMVNELEALMNQEAPGRPPAQADGHCSDVYAAGPWGFSQGHNEDWHGPVRAYAYLVKYTAAPGADFQSCAGFVYPGNILGWASTWNAHGVYFQVNSLFPLKNRPSGAAAAFAQREAVCGATAGMGQEAMIKEFTRHGWSSGASINLVDLKTGSMANLEVHEGQHSVHYVSNGSSAAANYSHFNMYKHLEPGTVDGPDTSSLHRQARVDALPPVRSRQDVIQRLSDTADAHFPIYRKSTLATLVVDGGTARMDVWCCGRSASSGPPLYSWDMLNFFDDRAGAEVLV